jgi:hypothetical protein
MKKLFLLTLVFVSVLAVSYIATAAPLGTPSQSASPECCRYDEYGFGGGGSYDPGLNAQWWRDWDASYNYPPGVGGRPPHKMWTVGKFNNRIDGPYTNTTLPPVTAPVIDAIFAYEAPIISGLIITGGYTGQVWEIGNEPNLWPFWGSNYGLYDYQFGLYCGHIKSIDATALCTNGGVVTSDLLWQYWVAGWIDEYNPDVDIWNVHPYGLSFSADVFKQDTIAFRQLIDAHGQPGKPIWITEYGWGSWAYKDPAEIATYAADTGDWLNRNHDSYNIDRWFWWGVYAGPNGMGSGGLFSGSPYSTTNQTAVGAAYLAARDAPLHWTWMPIFIKPDTSTIPTQVPYP